ncbi:MAG: hypothetical protein NC124_18075 [Clostridium sp.]|nr:hypothetical protein [Clostridium sp.]
MKKEEFIKAMAVISVIIAILGLLFNTTRYQNNNTFMAENMNTPDSYSLVIVYNNYNTSEKNNDNNELLTIIIQIIIKYFLDKINYAFKNNDSFVASKKHIIIIKFKKNSIIISFTISSSILLHIYIINNNKKP